MLALTRPFALSGTPGAGTSCGFAIFSSFSNFLPHLPQNEQNAPHRLATTPPPFFQPALPSPALLHAASCPRFWGLGCSRNPRSGRSRGHPGDARRHRSSRDSGRHRRSKGAGCSQGARQARPLGARQLRPAFDAGGIDGRIGGSAFGTRLASRSARRSKAHSLSFRVVFNSGAEQPLPRPSLLKARATSAPRP